MRTIAFSLVAIMSLSAAAHADGEQAERTVRTAKRQRVAGIALVAAGLAAGLPLLGVGAARTHAADGGSCCRDTVALNSAMVGTGVVLIAAAIAGAILWSVGQQGIEKARV